VYLILQTKKSEEGSAGQNTNLSLSISFSRSQLLNAFSFDGISLFSRSMCIPPAVDPPSLFATGKEEMPMPPRDRFVYLVDQQPSPQQSP